MTVQSPSRPGRDRWIPWTFVLGFLVVLGANGAMLYASLASWTGISTENAYERGLYENSEIAQAEAQRHLGWQTAFRFTSTAPGQGRVELALQDRYGNLLDRASVTARFIRPTTAGHDVEAELRHVGLGRYAADIALPLRGQWEVRLLAEEEHGTWRQIERVMAR